MGEPERAARYARRGLEAEPANAEAANNLGSALWDLGQVDEAIAAYRDALRRKPDLGTAWANVGTLLYQSQRYPEALEPLERAITIGAGQATLQYQLGHAREESGDLVGAEDALRRAVGLDDGLMPAWRRLANVLLALGRPDEAEAACHRAIRVGSDRPEPQHQLGTIHLARGEIDAAREAYRRALELTPNHIAALYDLTRNADQPEERAACISELERVVADTSRAAQELAMAHYALGQALDRDAADTDAAFEHYRSGAAYKRRQIDYDVHADEVLFERIAQTAQRQCQHTITVTEPGPDAPIFIVGMPRSGTTLLEQILARHPRVAARGERPELRFGLQRQAARHGSVTPPPLESLSEGELTALGDWYRRRLADETSASRPLDKMPGNFQFLPWLLAAQRDARVIHLRRDPLDTCVSCFTKLFHRSHPYSYDLGELGQYYQAYHRLMDSLTDILPEGFLLNMDYEELVSEPEQSIARVLAHCGLEWDPACLDFHRANGIVTTASAEQVRQPLHRGGLGRWRRYHRHLGPLIDALRPLARPDDNAQA
jgi:tetratricopeptide (TPR) repeat protein